MDIKFYFEKRVVAGFLLTVVVLLTLGLFSYLSTQRLIHSWSLLTQQRNVLTNTDLIIKHVVDMETGQRGYVITGNEEFLEPFYHSTIPLAGYIHQLDSLTAHDTVQSKRVDTLRSLISLQKQWTTQVIEARRESFEKASTLVIEGTGKLITDKIRQCAKRLQDWERITFDTNNTITSKSIQEFQYSFLGFAAGILIIILYLFYLINASLKARLQAEAILQASAAETHDLYNNAPCGYFSVDRSIAISAINQTLLNWIGYTEKEVIGKMKFEDLLAPQSRIDFLRTFEQDFEKYRTLGYVNDLQFDFIRKDKSIFPVSINSTALFNEKGDFVRSRSTVFNNTERKRIENNILLLNQELESKVEERTRKLAESQKIYKSIASNIPGSSITIIDREERYLLAEGDLLEQMGFNKASMLNAKVIDVISETRYNIIRPLLQRAFAGGTIIQELKSQSGRDVVMRVVPLKDEEEYYFAVMIVLIDISEVKKVQLELAELNSSLEKNVIQRTAQLNELNQELEAFTYSVSHDLRAPLRIISGYSQLLKEDYYDKLDSEGQQLTDRIIKNATRMGQLIDDLLNFSKLGRVELVRRPFNMDDLAKEVLQELLLQEGERTINVTYTSISPAFADASLLRQVWINLLSNALKYSRRKEVTVIEIGSFSEGEMICYYVRDNGAGFDMTYADKLFRVFQRLHTIAEFEGTGVGLALVYTIIKRHGGRVWAEGKPDEGATFYFSLPAK